MADGSLKTINARKGGKITGLKQGETISIQSLCKENVYLYCNAQGVPKSGNTKEIDSGFSIRKTFYETDGITKVNPKDFKQGKLYQVALHLKANSIIENIVISDLLPAGLEIVDPNLKGNAHAGIPGNYSDLNPTHVERRDDRMLIFTNGRNNYYGKMEFRYIVRAVTAGTFALPAVDAECMYNPEIYSTNGAGTIMVMP